MGARIPAARRSTASRPIRGCAGLPDLPVNVPTTDRSITAARVAGIASRPDTSARRCQGERCESEGQGNGHGWVPAPKKKAARRMPGGLELVEAGGIEPPSASPTLQDLHACPVY